MEEWAASTLGILGIACIVAYINLIVLEKQMDVVGLCLLP